APPTMYAVFDGLFQQSLARYLSGDDSAADALADGVDQILALVIPAR
ncbi:TetR/AcrR family transcriptional regulator, partial [Rhodococcus koreensis]